MVNLVAHTDDFSSIRNENGEYVLNYPIEYTYFVAILHSITDQQPYVLFNELSEYSNIFDALVLFDYVGVDSFPLTLLKDTSLVLSNRKLVENNEKYIVYRKANLLESEKNSCRVCSRS